MYIRDYHKIIQLSLHTNIETFKNVAYLPLRISEIQ